MERILWIWNRQKLKGDHDSDVSLIDTLFNLLFDY